MRLRLLSFPAAFLDLLHGKTISTVKTNRYEQSRAEKRLPCPGSVLDTCSGELKAKRTMAICSGDNFFIPEHLFLCRYNYSDFYHDFKGQLMCYL